MKRIFLIIAFILALGVPALSQVTSQNARRERSGTGAPSGACVTGPIYTDIYINVSDHSEWQCTGASTWTKVVNGGTPVSVSGSPASPELAGFSGPTSITNVNLTGDVTTADTLATTLKNTGTAGTYRSVTFDAQGRETSGTNPTTFGGYGLNDTSANFFAAITNETGSGLVMGNDTPTILTPTIASFTNATHNHQNAAGGGTLTLASAAFANQGTTITLLHGNAAGNPSFSAVVSADLNITTTTCTNQFLTAISATGTGTCTTVTLAGAQFANQGTTTTVLHGNAAGNPSFAAVALGTDVSGTLLAAQEPAHTGDVTNSAGSLALSIAANAVTLAKLATQATNTVLGNATSGTAVPTALAVGTCSAAGSALNWTTNTGFGCNTSITAAAAPVSGLTGAGTGVLTFLATPSGANLASALTTALPVSKGGTNCTAATITCFNNITGFSAGGTTGTTSTNLVFSTSPTITSATLATGVDLPGAVWITTASGASQILLFDTGINQYKTRGTTGSLHNFRDANDVTLFTIAATSVTAPNAFINSGITSDATHTDATVCEDTTSHQFYNGSGTLGICLGTSSARFKSNIASLPVGLAQIIALKPVQYRLDAQHGDPAKLLYGFTAEQGGEILPALMGRDVNGAPNTFDYLGVVPVIVRAMQDMQKEIDELKAKVKP